MHLECDFSEWYWLLDSCHLDRAVREVYGRLAELRIGDLLNSHRRGTLYDLVEREWRQITEAAKEVPFPWNENAVIRLFALCMEIDPNLTEPGLTEVPDAY